FGGLADQHGSGGRSVPASGGRSIRLLLRVLVAGRSGAFTRVRVDAAGRGFPAGAAGAAVDPPREEPAAGRVDRGRAALHRVRAVLEGLSVRGDLDGSA